MVLQRLIVLYCKACLVFFTFGIRVMKVLLKSSGILEVAKTSIQVLVMQPLYQPSVFKKIGWNPWEPTFRDLKDLMDWWISISERGLVK